MACPLGCVTLMPRSCGRGKEAGEEGRPDRRYETRRGAPGELLCVQVALWRVVVVCRPAGRMETMREEVEVERGCVPGCRLLMCVFCAGSCASVGAPEPRRRLHETARWRRRPTCAACTAEEVEELKSHLLAACWKTASRCWEGCGLCWASVGGASLGCEKRMRKVECVLSDWG